MTNQENLKKVIEDAVSCIGDGRNRWHETKAHESNIRKEYEKKLELLKNGEQSLASKSDENDRRKAVAVLLSNSSDQLNDGIEKLRRNHAELETKLNAQRQIQEANRHCYMKFMSDLEEKFRRAPDVFSDSKLAANIEGVQARVLDKEKTLEQDRQTGRLAAAELYAASPQADAEYDACFDNLQLEISNQEKTRDSLKKDLQSKKGQLSKLREELKKMSKGLP